MSGHSLDNLVRLIRADIRAEQPYLVGSAGEDECKLNQNECPLDLPPELKSDLLSRFERIAFNRYPDSQPFRLMTAIESFHGLPEGSVLVGNGSNDLTQTLGLCFVSSGTRVVLPRPMFALFESVVRMHSGEVVPIAPLPSLQFDMDAVISAASDESVSLTVVASPNNPTGLSVPHETLIELCETAPGFVVIDEAYHEFCSEDSLVPLLDTYPNLIVMRTLSKAYGLAGIRVGYLIANPAIIGEILKARLPFMIDRFSEATALSLLNRPDIVADRVVQMKSCTKALTDELRSLDQVHVLPSSTNFVIFKTRLDAKALYSRLSEAGIVIRMMGSYPELDGYLRVTAGTEPENKAFIDALKGALSETA